MDILEQKPASRLRDELKHLIKLLTYKKNKLELKGSASLTSQRYFSDYDLFCVVQGSDDFYNFIVELMKKIDEEADTWFIELKLQTKTGKKLKIYPCCSLKKEEWDKMYKNLDFVKIDLISRIDGFFTEVSCIYSFTDAVPSKGEYIASLEKDIRELKKEKKWYKILKRMFSIDRANNNKEEMLRLSKVFNGELGEEYQLISRLEALDTVLEHYQEPELLEKAEISLKDLKLPPITGKITEWVKEKSDKLNKKAKKFLTP